MIKICINIFLNYSSINVFAECLQISSLSFSSSFLAISLLKERSNKFNYLILNTTIEEENIIDDIE